MPIITDTGKFIDNIYLIDQLYSGTHRVASSFLYWDGETCLIMDIGTSDEVNKLMRYIRKMEIPYSKVAGIIVTQYHFDHAGGSTKLWSKMVEKNPDFKIMVPEDTYFLLQHAEEHLKGARTTFGEFIGTMNPAPEKAFQIIKKNEYIPVSLSNGYKIYLLATPGHCSDHCSHVVYKNNKPLFVFTGEAAGTLFHGSRLVSLPTSMPPRFDYKSYLISLQKIIDLDPISLGFCHFGAIIDEKRKETIQFLNEHKKYIEDFRNTIIKAYNEDPSTKYVMESIRSDLWEDRIDPYFNKSGAIVDFFKNLKLALVYGMMIDLGYRKPKYEQK